MKDSGKLESYVLSDLPKKLNPKHTSHFKLAKDPNLNRVNDALINKKLPITLYKNLLIFRDADENYKLKGDFFKMITIENYSVDLAKLPDRKLKFVFAKETSFDEIT